ncbi:MAG: YraN family protein, partial [Desulfobulbaceae bacterium]
MSESRRNILGLRGEELAAEYLLKKGYHLIERNYRNNFGEIDI